MRLDRFKSFALSLPRTSVVKQWGGMLVFKVVDKMFFLVALDADVIDGIIVKCRPEDFDDLTSIDGVTQAPYCAKRHWVKVGDLDAMPEKQILALVRQSYDLVVAKLPRKIQATLL